MKTVYLDDYGEKIGEFQSNWVRTKVSGFLSLQAQRCLQLFSTSGRGS
jgi:hypothetical protein